MPRGGIREKINNIGRGLRERCRSVPPFALLLAPFFSRGFVYRSSFFAPKPHGNACYAGYGGPREQCCSVPRGGVEKKKGSVADRESGVALCHGVALKKKDQSRTERAVSLCATRWRLKNKEREIGRGPREQYRSLPRGGVKKERIGRGPRERCRSVPQGGV